MVRKNIANETSKTHTIKIIIEYGKGIIIVEQRS